jgi:hypothetical protein
MSGARGYSSDWKPERREIRRSGSAIARILYLGILDRHHLSDRRHVGRGSVIVMAADVRAKLIFLQSSASPGQGGDQVNKL